MRRILIAGNWKMYKTLGEAEQLIRALAAKLPASDKVEVLVCPPFTALASAAQWIKDSSVHLGAQNMHWEREGAFTGEVSPVMLKDAGCEYVILGHSERRHLFGESDEVVNRKVKSALQAGLKPIVCIGETLQQRQANQTLEVVRRQLSESCRGLSAQEMSRCVIAYEPVWAIGTGVNATSGQAQEVHESVRKTIAQLWDASTAERQLILYGGSVKPNNIRELAAAGDIDGALVGGASLRAEDFIQIVQGALEVSAATSSRS